MKKRCLLIAYYFPPLGLAGISRPLHLFRQLEDQGWECHLLTVKPVTYRGYEWELLDELDQKKIFRSGSWDPGRLMYMLGARNISSKAIGRSRPISERFFPDSKAGWIAPAIRLGRTLIENYRYDLLLSTSPPVSSHAIGMKLAHEFKLPWLADFRDYWSTAPVEETFAKKRLVKKGQRLLEEIRQQASAMTTVNESIATYLGTNHIIPNGYDETLASDWTSRGESEKFVIGLPGHQHAEREIDLFLKVLASLRAKAPDNFAKVSLMQVGQFDSEWFQQEMTKHDLSVEMILHGQVPKRAYIPALTGANAFYLGLSGEKNAKLTTTRVYELIASGRPLLVSTDRGSEIEKLLVDWAPALCFDNESVDQASQFLSDQIAALSNGVTYDCNSAFARRFSSAIMVQRFAQLMDRLV